MGAADILKTILYNLANDFADRGFDMLINAYYQEKIGKKYEQVEMLEEAEIKEPAKLEMRKVLPLFLTPYHNKKVLLGFTWCPYCRQEYEEMRDEILEDKADALWIDNDVVAEIIAEDLDLDTVPAKLHVKSDGKKAVVKLLDENGNVKKVLRYTDIFEKSEVKTKKKLKKANRHKK